MAAGTKPLQSVSLVHRTDALLLRLSLVVGKEVFYAALWGSVLVSPAIRLPASLFVVGHISRDSPGKEQKYMLGTDYQLTVGALLLTGPASVCTSCQLGLQRGTSGEQQGNRGVLGIRVCALSCRARRGVRMQDKPRTGVFIFHICINNLHIQIHVCP